MFHKPLQRILHFTTLLHFLLILCFARVNQNLSYFVLRAGLEISLNLASQANTNTLHAIRLNLSNEELAYTLQTVLDELALYHTVSPSTQIPSYTRYVTLVKQRRIPLPSRAVLNKNHAHITCF